MMPKFPKTSAPIDEFIKFFNSYGIWLNNIYQDDDGTFRANFRVRGSWGCAYGTGKTPSEALRNAYEHCYDRQGNLVKITQPMEDLKRSLAAAAKPVRKRLEQKE
jgi:hypothetical protein